MYVLEQLQDAADCKAAPSVLKDRPGRQQMIADGAPVWPRRLDLSLHRRHISPQLGRVIVGELQRVRLGLEIRR